MVGWFLWGCGGAEDLTTGEAVAAAEPAAAVPAPGGTAEPPQDSGDADGVAPDSGDPGASDDGVVRPPPSVRTVDAPCRGDAVTALAVGGDGALWLGCGGDRGLFRSVDVGVSWEEPLVADNAYGFTVAALAPAPAGVWSCGVDPTVDPPVLLWDLSPTHARVALSQADGAADADELPLGACAAVAATGDRVLVLAKGGLALSNDLGATWRPLDSAEPRQIAAIRPALFTLSGDGSAPPVVGSVDGAAFRAGDATVPVALASPDGGRTLLLLGNSAAGATLARSLDAGSTWNTSTLGSFSAVSLGFGGGRGWIVGEAGGSRGTGVLLYSDDAVSWTEVARDLPALTALAVDASGAWIGGEGCLARVE